MSLCVHCGKKPSNRPRGLCWACYRRLEIRALYPRTSKFARLGLGNDNAQPPEAGQPTEAPPGSREKLDTLAARAERGEALHHPADATDWDGRSGQLLTTGDGPRAA